MIRHCIFRHSRRPYPKHRTTYPATLSSSHRTTTSSPTTISHPNLSTLLRRLKDISNAALCDADKSLRDPSSSTNLGLRIPPPNSNLTLYTRNAFQNSSNNNSQKLVGIARTVRCTPPNDFLPVLRGLASSKAGDVLIVDASDSTRAVAGELFATEASRRGVAGLVIDGPVRDVRSFADMTSATPFSVYATSHTPYSGGTRHVGELQVAVSCCGVRVNPGDVVVGDDDGIVVGGVEDFGRVIDLAEEIEAAEDKILWGMSSGEGLSLFDMTNFDEHVEKRMRGEDSSLQFRFDE